MDSLPKAALPSFPVAAQHHPGCRYQSPWERLPYSQFSREPNSSGICPGFTLGTAAERLDAQQGGMEGPRIPHPWQQGETEGPWDPTPCTAKPSTRHQLWVM